MAKLLSTIPVGVGAEEARLVESNHDGDGVSGVDRGEICADCGFWWWWIWGGEGVGLGGEACLGPKLGIGEVELLGVTTGKGLVEVVASFKMVWRTKVG